MNQLELGVYLYCRMVKPKSKVEGKQKACPCFEMGRLLCLRKEYLSLVWSIVADGSNFTFGKKFDTVADLRFVLSA